MSKEDWDHIHFLAPKGTKADIEKLAVQLTQQRGKVQRPGEVSREVFLEALAQALKGAPKAGRLRITKCPVEEG